MNLDLFNPHIRHAKRNKGRFSVRKGISRCYDARLFYFENTEGSLTIGENKYNLSNKTAVFLPPLTRYTISITVNDATVVDVFNFDLTRQSSHLITSLGTPTVDEFDGSLVPRCASIIGFDAPIIRHSSKISSHTSSAISSFTSQRGAWRERSSSHLRLALLELVDEPMYCEEVSVCEVIPCVKKIKLCENAKLSLFGDRMEMEMNGEKMLLSHDETLAVTVLGRNKLNVYSGAKIYQIKGSKRFNALKYVHVYHRYKNIKKGEESACFLGLYASNTT